MALRRLIKRRRNISVTSLIDVIFLLLLFFMLSSTFTRFAEIEISTAGGRAAIKSSPTSPLFLQLRSDGLRLNGQVVLVETVADRVRELAQDAAKTLLIVSNSADVTAQSLIDVLVAIRPLDDINIRVLE